MWVSCMHAQTVRVSGRVLEGGMEPVSFANVLETNSNQGASADVDGTFELLVNRTDHPVGIRREHGTANPFL